MFTKTDRWKRMKKVSEFQHYHQWLIKEIV
jgi:hypothetical protein